MAAHLYWRLNCSANNGTTGIALAEFILRTTPGGAQAATGGTASSPTGGTPANAFDGNNATMWVATVSVNAGGVLQYQFASAVDIVEYALTARNDSFIGDTPHHWTLEYSDNGTSWTVADTVRGQGAWASSEQRVYTVGANTGLVPAATIVEPKSSPAFTATPPAFKATGSFKVDPIGPKAIAGIARVNGVVQSGILVRVYATVTGEFVGQATTDGSGAYSVPCGQWPDVFALAFNPTTYRPIALDRMAPA